VTLTVLTGVPEPDWDVIEHEDAVLAATNNCGDGGADEIDNCPPDVKNNEFYHSRPMPTCPPGLKRG
jgi:hypothetical protein